MSDSNPATAFRVPAGASRTGETLNIFGELFRFKVTGKDNGGAFALFENLTQPGGGPPLHRHSREDEVFHVLDGEVLFQIDGVRIEAKAGDTLFAPRGTAHTFKVTGSTPATMLVLLQPAGLENFFAEVDAVEGPPDPAKLAVIGAKYGLELLGPPL
jgi:quercetin dioxygenase-like cupin family protein